MFQGYGKHYEKEQMELYRRKLALPAEGGRRVGEAGAEQETVASDELLVGLLQDTMEKTRADLTQTFRDLRKR